jgi:hypothetical protein
MAGEMDEFAKKHGCQDSKKGTDGENMRELGIK